jgi:threonyl-tRNA synthetase
MQRFPYILVVGDREMENQEISVRKRGGDDLGSMSIEAFVKLATEG